MDVPADSIRKIIEHVDTLVLMIEHTDKANGMFITDRETEALKILPSFIDELQRCLDANPPWRR